MGQYVPIDKVMHRLSQENGARPSIDLAGRIPGTSRVERTKAKSPKGQTTVKGLSPGAVKKTRISDKEWHVRTTSGVYIGMITKLHGNRYAYRLKGGAALVASYSTQKEAMGAMLRNV